MKKTRAMLCYARLGSFVKQTTRKKRGKMSFFVSLGNCLLVVLTVNKIKDGC